MKEREGGSGQEVWSSVVGGLSADQYSDPREARKKDEGWQLENDAKLGQLGHDSWPGSKRV